VSNHKIERHTWGLREALFREWEALRKGEIPISRAMASAKLATAILQSVETEIKLVNHQNNTEPGKPTAISAHVRLGLP
jgi:hypothetical protein